MPDADVAPRIVRAQPTHHALLDSAPMGRAAISRSGCWRAAARCSMAFPSSLLGVAMPLRHARFALSPLMVGLIGSALVLGAASGRGVGGPAADRFGRKPAFLVDMAIVAAGALISAMADAPQWIFFGQFLVGIGIGIDFPGQRVLRVRDDAEARAQPHGGRDHRAAVGRAAARRGRRDGDLAALERCRDWRWLLGATGVGAVLFLLLRFLLPESPRWLTEHGRAQEAARIVSGIAGRRPRSPQRPQRPSSQPIRRQASRRRRRMRLALLFSQALPHANHAGIGAVVPHGHRHLRRWAVHPLILGAIHISSAATGPLAADSSTPRAPPRSIYFCWSASWSGFGRCRASAGIHMQVVGFAGMTLGMLICCLRCWPAVAPPRMCRSCSPASSCSTSR